MNYNDRLKQISQFTTYFDWTAARLAVGIDPTAPELSSTNRLARAWARKRMLIEPMLVVIPVYRNNPVRYVDLRMLIKRTDKRIPKDFDHKYNRKNKHDNDQYICQVIRTCWHGIGVMFDHFDETEQDNGKYGCVCLRSGNNCYEFRVSFTVDAE